MTGFSSETYILFLALGFAVGTYGTLIGAGGGFVLMPVLLLLYPNESPETLTSISLAVVFMNALSGSAAYAPMRRIDYKSGCLFGLATVPGAIVGALNTSHVPRRLFDTVFGVLLVVASVFLALRPNLQGTGGRGYGSGRWWTKRHLVEADGMRSDYAFNPVLGVVLSLFVGYVSSFLGIGGGIIHVPALVFLLNFPVHVATATSHFILAIMALTGTLVHVLNGTLTHGVHHLILLSIGVVLGAQVGAHLSQVVKGQWIIRSLSVALGLVGVRILFLVLRGGI
jgi:uncharacterized membrane protein YfcA